MDNDGTVTVMARNVTDGEFNKYIGYRAGFSFLFSKKMYNARLSICVYTTKETDPTAYGNWTFQDDLTWDEFYYADSS
jgi:hypothetical protein